MKQFAYINNVKHYFLNNRIILPQVEFSVLDNSFSCTKGECRNVVFGLEWEFSDYSKESYVVFPGAVYNGNHFKSRKAKYPPMFEGDEIKIVAETIITDVPRLPKIELSTADMATPAIGLKIADKGYWLLTEQATILGDCGLNFYDTGIMQITAPRFRQSIYRGTFLTEEKDSGKYVKQGDIITIHYQLIDFPCGSVTSLFSKFMDIRYSYGERETPKTRLNEQVYRIQEEKYNKLNWQNEGYYSLPGWGDNYEPWQIGWCGGGIVTLPLYALGNEETKERVIKNVDFIISSQLESGFYIPSRYNGVWQSDGFGKARAENFALIRKQADAGYFLAKLYGISKYEPLKNSLIKLANALIKIWEENSQFGQFLDYKTGELKVGNSASGGIIPAFLIKMSEITNNPKYLEIAKISAQKYYDDFISNGYTTGGPGEILQCPDSESCGHILESFCVLYEHTNDEKWLSYSIDACNQLASWVVSYDYKWLRECELKRLNIKTTGSVIANAQNKHSAPGLCTLSGESIYKLYKWTNDKKYLVLIKEITNFMSQCMSTDESPVFAQYGETLPQGTICERVNMSDWETESWVGEVFNGSCWSEVSNMLAYLDFYDTEV